MKKEIETRPNKEYSRSNGIKRIFLIFIVNVTEIFKSFKIVLLPFNSIHVPRGKEQKLKIVATRNLKLM